MGPKSYAPKKVETRKSVSKPQQAVVDVKYQFSNELPSMNIRNFIEDPKEKKWQGPFFFIVAADPQFGMVGNYKLHIEEPCWEIEVQLATQAIEKINLMNPKPKFLVICGDLLDAYPFREPPRYYKFVGKYDDEYRKDQYKDFVEVFNKLDPSIKLVCVCGNHDIGEHPTKESLQIYYNQFGSDYYSFWVGGIKFVVLNSQLFFSPDSLPQEFEKQNKFLELIKDSRAKFIVVFQHIPFFLDNANEEDTYYNIGKKMRLRIMDKLKAAGVRYVFCGHLHENAAVKYKNMEIITTSALGAPMGKTPSGYRVVEVNGTGLLHKYITLCDTTEFKLNQENNHKCSCCSKCTIVYIRLKS